MVSQGDSAGCIPEQGLSAFFTKRRAHLKTSKLLAEPSFNGKKFVKFEDSLFSSYLPFTLNACVKHFFVLKAFHN